MIIELVWQLAVALLKVLGIAFIAYVFYWRVFDYYRAIRFYGSQGEDVCKICPYHLPIFGNAYMMAWSAWKSWSDNDNYHIMKNGFDYMAQRTKTMVCFISNDTGLGILDVKVVEAMYTTKNKYFDKHPLVGDLCFCLTGDSILFANTTVDWRKSRQAISPAFYKGKLERLVDMAKDAVVKTVDRFHKISTASGPKAKIDIMEEIGMMTTRILLVCALGIDCAEQPVEFWQNGIRSKVTLAHSLRETFANLINRMLSPHIVLFPMLARYHITPFERDQQRNAQALRDFCQNIIDQRRVAIEKNPELAKAGDFLTIMIVDEHFKDRNLRIVDECLTFFFAGSQTSSVTTQNLVFALCKHPEYQQLILEELDSAIIQPHLKDLLKAGKIDKDDKISDLDVLALINYENNGDLELYTNCFNESMRMQPPVYYSSSVRMSETVQCEKLRIRKGDMITIMMGNLSNDPKEWIEPERFIPERFDANSRYYLTPAGQRRNPYSFSPFLGGARICIGKTFIEMVSKLTLPTILSHYEFEFCDGVEKETIPFFHNNMTASRMLEFKARITPRNLTYSVKA